MTLPAEPFQIFPALDAATEAALRASIERFGVLVPVAKDQHGRVIDGYHRKRIADELGVSYRVDLITVSDDEQAREIAQTLNSDRRQMSADQRREVEAVLREQGHSLRAIAGAVGISQEQVRRDLSTVTDVTVPDRIVGIDGKSRPSTRPSILAVRNERDAEYAQAHQETLHAAIEKYGDPRSPEIRDRIKQSRAPFKMAGDLEQHETMVRVWDHAARVFDDFADNAAAKIAHLVEFSGAGPITVERLRRVSEFTAAAAAALEEVAA